MLKTILIGGASGNIGSFLMKFFSEKGYEVYGIGRRQMDFENVNCHYTSLNIENSENVRLYFSHLRKNKISLDCYIHCIGKDVSIPIGLLSKDRIDDSFSAELGSEMLFIKEVVSNMSLNKSGFLINLSSIVVTAANHGSVLYGMKKVALEQFFKIIANEYQRFGVQTCSIRVPIVEDTEMAKQLLPNVFNKLKKYNSSIEPFNLKKLAEVIHDVLLGNKKNTSENTLEL